VTSLDGCVAIVASHPRSEEKVILAPGANPTRTSLRRPFLSKASVELARKHASSAAASSVRARSHRLPRSECRLGSAPGNGIVDERTPGQWNARIDELARSDSDRRLTGQTSRGKLPAGRQRGICAFDRSSVIRHTKVDYRLLCCRVTSGAFCW
jgi:hypothetical protein